jgi:hypothetical protein
MTGAEMVLQLQDWLDDERSKTWKAGKSLRALNLAKDQLSAFANGLNRDWFTTYADIPSVIGQREYSLPDGTLYSAAYLCPGIVDFLIVQGYDPVRQGDFRYFLSNTTSTWSKYPESFAVVGRKLWVNPKPAAVVAMRIFYPYSPAAIANTSADYTWIPGMDWLIPLKAAILAKIPVADELADFKEQLAQGMNQLVMMSPRVQGFPERINVNPVGDAETEI